MSNYGIKISRPEYNVPVAAPEQLSYSSKYETFKIHTRGSGTVNSASGGGLVTIAHNLGYVPAFLVHADKGQTGDFCIAPYGESDTQLVYAYADSINLYIKAVASSSSFTTTYNITNDNCMYRQGGGFEADGGATIGTIGSTTWSGALRFTGINIAQGTSVSSATLYFYGGDVGAGSFANQTCKGIDEDNTDVFNNPFSRTTTTASTAVSGTVPAVGNYFNITVTSIVNEILGRAGWSSGNAMGFTIRPDSTGATGYMYDDNDTTNSYLSINISTSTATVADYKYTIFKNQIE